MTNDQQNEWGNSQNMITNKTGVRLLIHGRWISIFRFPFFLFHLVLQKHFILQINVQSERLSKKRKQESG